MYMNKWGKKRKKKMFLFLTVFVIVGKGIEYGVLERLMTTYSNAKMFQKSFENLKIGKKDAEIFEFKQFWFEYRPIYVKNNKIMLI